jgi:Holliday junction resolvase RusA-like endonuclease
MRRFVVVGAPLPKGNKKAVRTRKGLRVRERDPRVAEYGQLVKVMAGSRHDTVISGPVGVQLHFSMPKPKKVPKERLGWPAAKPDMDKLMRTVWDGLSKIQFDDDGGVCWALSTKQYVKDGQPPSVIVQVDPLRDHANATIPCVNCPHLTSLFEREDQ